MSKLSKESQEAKEMLSALEQALYSNYQQSWDTHQRRGSLDPRRCYRALCGAPDVFRTKDIVEERKSAVSLVTDLSCSMEGTSARALGVMVNGFQEVFRNSQVNWELTGFKTHACSFEEDVKSEWTVEVSDSAGIGGSSVDVHNGTSTGLGRDIRQADSRNYDNFTGKERVGSGNAIRIKSFGKQTPRTALGDILARSVGGGTSDAQVYRLAMNRLAQQEESTKLLIYLGDGAGNGMPYVSSVNATAKEKGIISMGIGLGSCADVVEPWAFDTCIHVYKANELKKDAFLKSTQIINQLRRVRCK